MAWTKRQLIAQAFEELAIGEDFELSPYQWQNALVRLDSMMATWNNSGIRLGYPIPSSQGSSDLDQDSGVPDVANEAIFLNLAIRLAPSFGKQVSPDTRASAKTAYGELEAKAAFPMEMQLPGGMPLGAGYKRTVQRFTAQPEEQLLAGQDGPIDFT